MDAADAPTTLTADEAFTWFFRAEFPRVVRTVALVLQDSERARDVAQEAFLQLLTHWEKVSRYDRPEAWVRRVAIRLAVRGRRRDVLRWTREQLAGPPQDEAPDLAGALDLAAAVRRLPPAQRAAVALFYYEDQPVSEVAAILGCTPATVRVHLHTARRRLGMLLGEVPSDAG
jgi:RNA polymerase sigma-70 factor (ECF subfamily)